jgi:hypothetical protein
MQANNDPIIININSNDDSFFHACGSDSSDCDKSSVREIRNDILRTEKKGFWTLIALVVAIWCLVDSVEWAASSLRGSNLVRDAAVSRVEEIPFPGRTEEDKKKKNNNNNKLWNKLLASGMIEHRENDDDDDGEDIVGKGLFGPNHHISKNLAGEEIHRPVDDFSKDEPSMAIPLQQQPQPRKPTYQGRTDRNNNKNEQSTSGMIEPREIDDDDADNSSDGSFGPHHLVRENLASKEIQRSHDDFVKDETGMAIPLRQQPQPRKPVGAETMQ